MLQQSIGRRISGRSSSYVLVYIYKYEYVSVFACKGDIRLYNCCNCIAALLQTQQSGARNPQGYAAKSEGKLWKLLATENKGEPQAKRSGSVLASTPTQTYTYILIFLLTNSVFNNAGEFSGASLLLLLFSLLGKENRTWKGRFHIECRPCVLAVYVTLRNEVWKRWQTVGVCRRWL